MAGGSYDENARDNDAPAEKSERVIRQRVPRETDVGRAGTTQAAEEQVPSTERAKGDDAATAVDSPPVTAGAGTGTGTPESPGDHDAPDAEAATDAQRSVDDILKDAEQRDSVANVRDSAANRRDVEANLAALLKEEPDQEAFEARAHAKQDRSNARQDRTASAEDRTKLAREDPPPKT